MTENGTVIPNIIVSELKLELQFIKLWFQNWNGNCNSRDYGSRTVTGAIITSGYWNNTTYNNYDSSILPWKC